MQAASCGLILLDGILYASWPHMSEAVYIARAFNGIAYGFAVIPFLMHTSEITSKSYRGLCGYEQYGFSIGIAAQMLLMTFTYDQELFNPSQNNRLHGICDILWSLIAACSLLSMLDSPIAQLRKGNETEAFKSLLRLDGLNVATADTHTKFAVCKDYVRDQENMTLLACAIKSAWPLIKMIVFRSMMLAFTFSIPLSQALITSSYINSAEIWAPSIAALLRFAGSCFALFFINGFSRKLPSIISSLAMGILIVVIAINIKSFPNSIAMGRVTWFCIITQLLAGCYAPYTAVHIAEAFPLMLKSYCIAICVVVEQLLQIIVINAVDFENYATSNILWAEGLLICAGSIFMIAAMPETKGTTLEEAHKRFGKLFN